MKKILAVMLAAVMLLAMTGCTEPSSEPQNDILTLEDYLGVMTEPTQNSAYSDLSFEMTYSLGNNDQLNAFVDGVGMGLPVSYTRSVSSEGYDASLTVNYNAPAVTMELSETYYGETVVQTYENVTLSIPRMYELYMDEEGNVDSNSFMMAIYQTGLYGWYTVNPSIFTQCVHYLIATLPTGEQLLVDYYYNEKLAEQLELLYAAQG